MREEVIGYLVRSHLFVIKMVIVQVGEVRVVNEGESEAVGQAGVRLAQGYGFTRLQHV